MDFKPLLSGLPKGAVDLGAKIAEVLGRSLRRRPTRRADIYELFVDSYIDRGTHTFGTSCNMIDNNPKKSDPQTRGTARRYPCGHFKIR